MSDHDDFLAWVKTALYEAELALHNGERGPAPGAVVTERARQRARCVAECARAVRAP